MIKLKDLITGIVFDPFTGDLQEGLTRTVPIEQAMEVLGREVENYPELDFLNDGNTIIVGFKPTYATEQSSKYSTGTLYDPKISKVIQLTNNLGYFPSVVYYKLNNPNQQKPKSTLFPSLNDNNQQYSMKYNSSKFRELVSNEQPPYLKFFFEAKYDPEVEIPKYVYHTTTTRFVDKIKQIGLTPKTLEKRSAHPERIYVSLSKKDSDLLFKGLKQHFGKNQGVELTIDTSLLKGTFYEDPNFKGQGAYTYQNIPPQAIVGYTPIKEI